MASAVTLATGPLTCTPVPAIVTRTVSPTFTGSTPNPSCARAAAGCIIQKKALSNNAPASTWYEDLAIRVILSTWRCVEVPEDGSVARLKPRATCRSAEDPGGALG